MHAFTDKDGRQWRFEITVGSAKIVKALVGVNLYSLVEDRFAGLQKLLGNPETLIDVLYVLCCRCGIEGQESSDVAFGCAFAGQSVADATEAFLQEYLDFFPERRVAEALRKAIEKTKGAAELLMAEAIAEVDQQTPESMLKHLKERYTALPG